MPNADNIVLRSKFCQLHNPTDLPDLVNSSSVNLNGTIQFDSIIFKREGTLEPVSRNMDNRKTGSFHYPW